MKSADMPTDVMTAQNLSDQRAARLRWIPPAASASAVLTGCLVLVGWWVGLGILKDPLPGFPTMKANTALAFVLAGSALWLLRVESARARSRCVAQLCASMVVVISLLALGEYLSGQDLGIDRLQLQGSGLGLVLTKQLVELHGGTIAVASAGHGQGSTFTVRLPLAPAESPE